MRLRLLVIWNQPNPRKINSYCVDGARCFGLGPNGTGKTASFTLPMIDILSSGRAKARLPRSLILTPTRELAAQVAESFDAFSKNHNLTKALLIGGTSFGDQDATLAKGVDVLIATPGRLMDHVERGKVMLNDVKILVIDEADRMLDMGFIPDVEKITSLLPKFVKPCFILQRLMKPSIRLLINLLSTPKWSSRPARIDSIDGWTVYRKAKIKEKRQVLRDLIRQEDVSNAVIFCNRKRDISTVRASLERHGFNALALHGDMTQAARNEALAKFKDGDVPLLVASDVAARGIDIAGLSHVFNFDVPMNAEDYVHRIGRTGRAGRSGRAFTIIATKDDQNYLDAIEKLIGKSVDVFTIDGQDNTPPSNDQSSQDERSRKPKSSQSSPSKSNQKRNKKRGNVEGELPMPEDCTGDSFKTTEHTPAFLLG